MTVQFPVESIRPAEDDVCRDSGVRNRAWSSPGWLPAAAGAILRRLPSRSGSVPGRHACVEVAPAVSDPTKTARTWP